MTDVSPALHSRDRATDYAFTVAETRLRDGPCLSWVRHFDKIGSLLSWHVPCFDHRVVKVALTVWNGWISPVFDVCREAIVLEANNGGDIISTDSVQLGDASPLEKIACLVGLGAETLICGAISSNVLFEAGCRGLEVIAFVAGETDEIVQAFLAGRLPSPTYAMPGCCARQHRGRRRRRRRRHTNR